MSLPLKPVVPSREIPSIDEGRWAVVTNAANALMAGRITEDEWESIIDNGVLLSDILRSRHKPVSF